jgi:hypothetical protein
MSSVIVQNLSGRSGDAARGQWFSEITQSERWSRSVGVEIRSRRTTSFVAAPRDFYEAETPSRIAPAGSVFHELEH